MFVYKRGTVVDLVVNYDKEILFGVVSSHFFESEFLRHGELNVEQRGHAIVCVKARAGAQEEELYTARSRMKVLSDDTERQIAYQLLIVHRFRKL